MSRAKPESFGSTSDNWFVSPNAPFTDGRYELKQIIGEGGGGRVYRALDRQLGRDVALKTLRAPAAEHAYRLKKEFRSLVDVAHPHIVRLYDLFVSADRCFFTMELIEGPNFLEWARDPSLSPGTALDQQGVVRLRKGLCQLAEAVQALHELGKLHRDIKPSNVLVGKSERIVLVDVGLSSRIELYESQLSRFGAIAGTIEYMAPEQLWGKDLTRAADWYSFGVVLYEALCGKLPYELHGMGLVHEKRSSSHRPPSLPSGVPADLAALATDLLSAEPGERPDFTEICRQLGRPAADTARLSAPAAAFVGRRAELDLLETLRSQARARAQTFVHVSGPAGVGKTALLDRFLHGVSRSDSALVLRGRCHYREYLSFNALDGVVDDLSRYLGRLEDSAIAELVPPELSALLQVFPVLGRIAQLRQLHPPSILGHDARLRHLAFISLKDTLRKLSSELQLVVCIDDLQWIDTESLLFLRMLEQSSGFKGALFLFSYRSDEEQGKRLASLLGSVEPSYALSLRPLSREDVEDLVGHLAADTTGSERAALVEAAQGNPLFVRALCAEADRRDVKTLDATSSFEQLIERKLDALTASALDALRLICALPHAVDQRLIAAAASASSLEEDLSFLQRDALLRQALVRSRVCWEPTEDRIRRAAMHALSAAERTALYERLSSALRAVPDPDPHTQLELFLGSARRTEAIEHALREAEQATRRAAFETAASLYSRVLELDVSPDQEWTVRSLRGSALANAGRVREGAAELLAASNALARVKGNDLEVLRLRAAAGERYLLSGYWDEGFELVHSALAAVDQPYARSAGGAVLKAVMSMPRAAVAEKVWDARSRLARKQPTALDRLRLDIVWSAGLSISWMDPMRAIELQVRHAALAYAAGHEGHIALTKSANAVIKGMLGGQSRWREAERLQREAQRLAERSGDPAVQTFVAVYSGVLEFFMGHWQKALRLCERALELAQKRAVGFLPVLSLAEWTCLTCLAYLGEVEQIRARILQDLLAVEARKEQLHRSLFRVGWISFPWLCADEPDEAAEQARVALGPYQNAKFNSVHYLHAVASCNTHLYCGRLDEAWNGIQGIWESLKRSMQLQMTTVHADLHDVRGRAAVARAAVLRDRREQQSMIAEARRSVEALAKSPLPSAEPLSNVLRASIAHTRAERANAVTELEKALVAFERLDMSLHAAACRLRMAALRDRGQTERAAPAALDWFRSQGIVQPERVSYALVPMRP